MAGLFVVLEGIDGGGKTAQVRRLVRELKKRGHRALGFSDSKHGHWGAVARAAARGERLGGSIGEIDDASVAEFRLIAFCRDRFELAQDAILPLVASGGIAVCDRWEHSSWAYHRAAGVPVHRIKLWTGKYAPALGPDLAFLLRATPEVALSRIDRAALAGLRPALRHHYEDAGFLARVQRCYEHPLPEAKLLPLVTVNAMRAEREITADLAQHVIAELGERRRHAEQQRRRRRRETPEEEAPR